jgi:uncharacterized protein (TIGR03067 family)
MVCQFIPLLVWWFASEPMVEKPSQKTPAPLSGTWKILSAHYHGKMVPGRFIKDVKLRVTVTADQIMLAYFWDRARSEAVAYRLDGTQKPAWITGFIEGAKDRPLPGIYTLEKDRLTVCFSLAQKPERPREFKSTAANEQVVVLLQRVKLRRQTSGGKP